MAPLAAVQVTGIHALWMSPCNVGVCRAPYRSTAAAYTRSSGAASPDHSDLIRRTLAPLPAFLPPPLLPPLGPRDDVAPAIANRAAELVPGGSAPGRAVAVERSVGEAQQLAHFAAELDKDAQEVQAGLTAGKLPPWVSQTLSVPE